VFLSWVTKVRGAEGGEVWGGGVPLRGVSPSPPVEGSGEGAMPPPQNFLKILHHEMAYSGAFWALYFTVQMPALHT